MDANAKMERLKLLKQAHQRTTDREGLQFGGIPLTRDEITEEVKTMDTFQEEQRERHADRINSDEA